MGPAADTGGANRVESRVVGYSGYPPTRQVPRRTGPDEGVYAPPGGPSPAAGGRRDAGGRAAILPPAHWSPAVPGVDPLTPSRTALGPAPTPAATAPPLTAPPRALPSSASHAIGTPELDRDGPSGRAPGEAGFASVPHPSPGVSAWDDDLLSHVAPPAALSSRPSAEAAMTEALRVEPAPESDEDDGGWKPSTTVRKKVDRGGAAPPRVSPGRASSTGATSGMARTGAKEGRRASSGRAAVGTKRGASRLNHRPGATGRTGFDADQIDDVDYDLDADFEADGDEENDHGDYPSGFFARYRHGWVGPLIVAVVVSLIAIGAYVMLIGGNGHSDTAPTSGTATSRPGGSLTPTTSNPDAAAGQALIDGAYRCYQADSADLKPLTAVADKLVVPMGRGVYIWNAQQGTYTITRNSLSTDTQIFADVQFTGGPLKDVKALFFDRVRQGDAGKDVGALTFEDGTNRWCAIN